jgi:Transcriptional regulator PadR-like family
MISSTWTSSEAKYGIDFHSSRNARSHGPAHTGHSRSPTRLCDCTRLEQVSAELLKVNQGTLYPAVVRLEQNGWIKGTWAKTYSNREAKYYAVTRAGLKGLEQETQRWRQMAGVMDKLLTEES